MFELQIDKPEAQGAKIIFLLIFIGLRLTVLLHKILPEQCDKYCKSGNFRMTFISQIFDFQIISKFLNSQASTHAVYKA